MEWLINRRRMMYNKVVPVQYLDFEDERVWELCCFLWGDTELVQGKVAEGIVTCDGSALVYSDSIFFNCTAIPSHKLSNKANISTSAETQNFNVIIEIDDNSIFSSLGDNDVAIRIVQHSGDTTNLTEITTVTKAQWASGSSNNQMTISGTTTNTCKYLQVGVYGANNATASWIINAVTGNRQPIGITAAQCEAVTSFGSYFNSNRLITKFDNDSNYFTGVIGAVGYQAFAGTMDLTYARFQYATTMGGGDAANYAAFMNNTSGPNLRLDAVTKIRALYTVGTVSSRYVVITTSEPPSTTCRFIRATCYVLDNLVSSYLEDTYFGNSSYATIKSIHDLPTDHPDCPWLDDLRAKGLIPTT